MQKTMLIDTSSVSAAGPARRPASVEPAPAEETEFKEVTRTRPAFSGYLTKIAFRERDGQPGALDLHQAGLHALCPGGLHDGLPGQRHFRTATARSKSTKKVHRLQLLHRQPFNVIGFDQAANVAQYLCEDRLAAGLIPACAKACPSGAITFGDRHEMISLAERRIQELRRAGNSKAEIYGLEELDGLGMMYILKDGREDAMAKYGLPENPRVRTSAHIWNVIFKPVRAIIVLALAFALWINKSESAKEAKAS